MENPAHPEPMGTQEHPVGTVTLVLTAWTDSTAPLVLRGRLGLLVVLGGLVVAVPLAHRVRLDQQGLVVVVRGQEKPGLPGRRGLPELMERQALLVRQAQTEPQARPAHRGIPVRQDPPALKAHKERRGRQDQQA